MKGEVIKTVKHGEQEVLVVKEPNLIGYRFDAVGTQSLPLAVDLALAQARNMPKREAESG